MVPTAVEESGSYVSLKLYPLASGRIWWVYFLVTTSFESWHSYTSFRGNHFVNVIQVFRLLYLEWWFLYLGIVLNSSVYFFLQLLALVGDQLDDADNICGAVLSVRFNEDIISVWNRNASDHQVSEYMNSLSSPPLLFGLEYWHIAMFSVNRQWWVWETQSSGIWSCLMHMSWNTSPTTLLSVTTLPTETHGWEDRFSGSHCISWRGEDSGRSRGAWEDIWIEQLCIQ